MSDQSRIDPRSFSPGSFAPRSFSPPGAARSAGRACCRARSRRRLGIESLEVRRLLTATPFQPELVGDDAEGLGLCTCGCCRPEWDPGLAVYPALPAPDEPDADWYGSASFRQHPLSDLHPEVLPAVEAPSGEGEGGASPQGSLVPLSSVPVLNSRPGAHAKIYLNFVGDTRASWGPYSPGVTPAYDTDGDPTTFSSAELAAIHEIWARVAEKYSPFNVNVTTVDPGNINNLETMRVVIGGNGSWFGPNAGGIAYVGSFYSNNPSTGQNVAFVFSQNLGGGNAKFVAEAAAHEAGHTFGLEHQSVWNGASKTNEYNPGDAFRAPVMGNSYNAVRGLWWYGRNALSGGPFQDDMAVIAGPNNGFGYRADDHGNSIVAATALAQTGNTVYGSGVIEVTSDLDYFSFNTTPGRVRFTVSPASFGPMLDASLELRDATGVLLVSAATSSLGESLTFDVAGGTFYVAVKSKGDYGDVGQYTLVGTLPDAYENNDTFAAAADVGTGPGILLPHLNIDRPGDDDWFRFTLDQPGSIDVTAAFTHSAGNLNMQVTDAAGVVLATANSVTDNELIQLANLAAGAYYVRVFGVGSAVNSYSLSIVAGTIPSDFDPPKVVGVTLVNGSGNQSQYALPAGSGEQLVTVPLGAVQQIRVSFDEAVVVDQADLTVTGVQVAQYAISGFAYDDVTYTATWTLAQPIGADLITLHLNADGPNPIADLAGNRLDGEWNNPGSPHDPVGSTFPSGDGAAGGDFEFLFSALPGDANRDGFVDAADYTLWADRYLQSGSWGLGDFNDDGVVDGADFTIWADNYSPAAPANSLAVGENEGDEVPFASALPEQSALSVQATESALPAIVETKAIVAPAMPQAIAPAIDWNSMDVIAAGPAPSATADRLLAAPTNLLPPIRPAAERHLAIAATVQGGPNSWHAAIVQTASDTDGADLVGQAARAAKRLAAVDLVFEAQHERHAAAGMLTSAAWKRSARMLGSRVDRSSAAPAEASTALDDLLDDLLDAEIASRLPPRRTSAANS